MKQNLSPQTSSFIILASMCFFGGFLVILISGQLLKTTVNEISQNRTEDMPMPSNGIIPTALAFDEVTAPDTATWQDHKYTQYGITFKTPSSWKVSLPKKQGDFLVGEINPGNKHQNIKIYISPSDYYVMDGLPAVKTMVGGQPALDVSNILYGVSFGGYYFTIDLGPSINLVAEFKAMVNTIEFVK